MCSPPLSLLPQTAILVPASRNQCHRTQSRSCPGCRELGRRGGELGGPGLLDPCRYPVAMGTRSGSRAAEPG
uniref:Uncharacterized protein n=1 Tax=Rangifer tarandus platyrhynchus TaxID=3082113 RepID=A0ACB0E6T7_RANTA|nr:unnamed protein product [Rangifer tarandus platyrhynchus]